MIKLRLTGAETRFLFFLFFLNFILNVGWLMTQVGAKGG